MSLCQRSIICGWFEIVDENGKQVEENPNDHRKFSLSIKYLDINTTLLKFLFSKKGAREIQITLDDITFCFPTKRNLFSN